jgi:hypothetical protein
MEQALHTILTHFARKLGDRASVAAIQAVGEA